MQVKKSAVVGVLITLYLSTDSWCHYIPETKTATSEDKKNDNPTKIQICGNALTTFIIEACNGIVGTLNQANLSRDTVQTKITEDCCDKQCPVEYLQNYCGETPLFFNKKNKGKMFEKLGLGPGVNNNPARTEKKKKKKFPAEDNRNNKNRQNNINRSWPSIEIGTVSPEIDQFGGQPIVMLKKTKSNAI